MAYHEKGDNVAGFTCALDHRMKFPNMSMFCNIKGPHSCYLLSGDGNTEIYMDGKTVQILHCDGISSRDKYIWFGSELNGVPRCYYGGSGVSVDSPVFDDTVEVENAIIDGDISLTTGKMTFYIPLINIDNFKFDTKFENKLPISIKKDTNMNIRAEIEFDMPTVFSNQYI